MLGRTLLVYKQHRFEVLVVVGIGIFLIVGSIVEGLRLNAIHLPEGCAAYTAQYIQQGMSSDGVTAACLAASRQWLDVKNGIEMNFIPTSPWMVPLFFGVVLGAPLVAREIENGTAPLSWALAGSRRRWLAWRLAAMIVLLVPLMILLGLASDFLDAAANPGMNPWASFTDYAGRGAILVFWGLAAFAGTVALSSMLGRTMPALIIAAIVCLVVRGSWEQGANRTFLVPFDGMLVTQAEADSGQFDLGFDYQTSLVTYYENWLDGKPYLGDVNQWWQEHVVFAQPTTDSNGNIIGVAGPQGPLPYQVPYGFSGSMYWPVVAYESGILLCGAILFAAVGLFWVGRRRPY
jgi:hypothetical protein